MQEHRKEYKRRKRKFEDSNFAICAAARSSVLELTSSIDGGEDFAYSYLSEEFAAKYCDETLTPSSERRANAIRKLRECEVRNAAWNEILRDRDPGYNLLPRVSYKSFLRFARRLIRDILGPLSNELVVGEFSGGASTSRRRTESHPASKYVGKADVTESAVKYIDLIKVECPLLKEYAIFDDVRVVEGNILFTVPKKTDIDRCACKEPDINMFLQKGVGARIRRRLRRFGIDLNDQSLNRRFAEIGSKDNSLATLDLSSASDTITIEAVRALLPLDWFLYLNDIRSQQMEIDGDNYRTEMFSSMGNGFTFELESLIFFALMRATAYFEGISGVISVYGDDIVIPSGMFDAATWLLHSFGFTVNMEKSFSSGFFRESCGGHYFHGLDVTPFYLKRKPTRLTDVIRVANQLRRWAFADEYRQYEIPGLYRSWCKIASFVPKGLWGGYDYALDTKLVSPPGGRHVLQRVTSPVGLPSIGSYAHWHNTNWNRQHDPKPGRDSESTVQKCRLRRAKPGAPVCLHFFHEELV